ncbi:hypothetical protein M2387_000358 [Klebsiella sp. BIGb0407]|nr:hypothetical protein [Klebsiella sp. BIGb0407]
MMKSKIVLFINALMLLLLVMASTSGWARCKTTGVAQTEDSRTAAIPFGRINLYDSYFYPVGSLLASVVVPPTNYTYGGANAGSVLWECDASDLSSIYFLVATNGDHWLGGFNEIGIFDGLPGVYATYFANIGLKQTMGDVVLSRYWKKLPVSTYATSGSKIQIRLQDIPPLVAELYRVSQLPTKGGGSQFGCTSYFSGSTSGGQYTCDQPNAYIQLVGPNLVHDDIGEDSYKKFSFWGVDNGFGYGMKDGSTLYNTSSCVARSATPLVKLPPISMNELNSGLTSTASFNVSVECNNGVASGTGAGQTAIGFQVSSGSYSAAKTLGLVNSSDGVSTLLSDNYNNAEMAKGVGILISYQNAPAVPLTLIGQNSTNTGSNAGWYPVLNNAIAAGSSKSGYTNYNYNFVATLKRINGKTASVGKVRATATVLVRMQ